MDKNKSIKSVFRKRSNKKKTDNNRNNSTESSSISWRDEKSQKTKKYDGVSLNKITELMLKRPEEILLKLCNEHFGFEKYLNAETMGNELIKNLVNLMEKVLECNTLKHKLKEIIEKFVDSKLLQTHVLNLISKPISNSINMYNYNLIKSVLNITCSIIELDYIFVEKLQMVQDRLEILITRRMNDEELKKEFEDRLFLLIQQAKEMNEKRRNYKTFKNIDYSDMEPPDDFTQMSIIPTLSDILFDQNPFLRKNITNGAYNSVHHYLDVQFRLLREDYLQPLRDGVYNFRKIIKEANIFDFEKTELSKEIKSKLKKIDTLTVFFDVKLNSNILSNSGLAFQMQMFSKEEKKQASVNWENSKKLMFGSLLCFSSDLFQNECLIGVVCERDLKNLSKNIVTVKFDYGTEYNDSFDSDSNFVNNNMPQYGKNYIMLETSAYFESYKHVLEALVSFKNSKNDDDFPFKQHIVDSQNNIILRPKYLTNVGFDFRPIVDSKKKIHYDKRTQQTTYTFSDESKKFESCILTNEFQWPKAENMRLDESQYNAVKLALENRLTLIQGPPGTGKTFIGVKIVELLLHNKKLWWNKPTEPHRPILMICYTNHALDQFLEYCIDECQLNSGIVRVGGRSQTERLQPFLLSNIKKNLKQKRQIDGDVFYRIKDHLRSLADIKSKSEQLNKEIKKLVDHECILSMNTLKEIIEPDIYAQFTGLNLELNNRHMKSSEDFTLLEWLGLFEIDDYYCLNDQFNNLNIQDPTENTQNEEDNQDNQNEEDNQENQQDVEDETNEINQITNDINDERMLEDDFEIFRQNFRKDQHIEYSYDCLIYPNDISEMLIKFNYYHGSNVLNYLIKSKDINTWQEVKRKRKKNHRHQNLSGNSTLLDKFIIDTMNKIAYANNDDFEYEDTESNQNIWLLSYEQRARLYSKWCKLYIKDLKEQIIKQNNLFNLEASKLKELRLQEDSSVMKDALIIAMTTTGSSRYHNILKDIAPRIVIVEEAAEVFEAHIVSSLSKKCEHLILIGDHVQLRPNPSVYRLAKEFELDVSLFERLVKNNCKKVTLLCQHRSRPEISCLMKHFYKEQIEDYHSVKTFENIIGLNTNIFFMNHSYLEQSLNEGQSKLNEFEALFIAEFCHYLIKQNQFQQSKITVLSMYLGQMIKLRVLMKKKKLNEVKVMTVDNYQGEENDIVVLSLVRSNKNDSIGFLSTPNRVCVALSRARKGFYCIGNIELLRRNNQKWNDIICDMEKLKKYGNALKLTCGVHPQNDIEASEPEDFEHRPNGGCMLPCDFRLRCGHVCALKCHTFDREHVKYKCQKTCDKEIPLCSHQCKQICSHNGSCFICGVKVFKLVKECGHLIKMRCDKEPIKADCTEPCSKILNCGHMCSKKCGQDCGECEKILQIDSFCKHSEKKINIACKNINKVWLYQNQCKEKCDEKLDCGHKCKSRKCCGYIHDTCTEKCKRILICNHESQENCSEKSQSCSRKCENQCPHSKCQLKCSNPCKPCVEKCAYKCIHMKCSKKCHELCDKEPCNQPCSKILKCLHQCIGFCGEPCPKLCRICDKKHELFTEIFFGTEDEPNARFVYLVDCGHIIESTGMEQWLKSRYDENNNENDKNTIQLPCCPHCKTPIRRTLRYSKYYKSQLKAIEEIKLKQNGNQDKNRIEQLNLLNEINALNEDKSIEKNFEDKSFLEAIKKDLFIDQSIYADLNQSDIYSSNDLIVFRNLWTIFKRSIELTKKLNESKYLEFNQINHIFYEITKIKKLLYTTDNNKEKFVNLYVSQQELNEMSYELERIGYLFNYFNVKNQVNKSKDTKLNLNDLIKVSELLNKLEKNLILCIRPFKNEIKCKCDKIFEELKKLITFELSKEEKMMIVKAIGLEKGHWFKCPNGHIYCIGECGGAMEKSKCPDCKADIGGQNHALVNGNVLASEMDGASYAAWSDTANNLRNWDLN